MADQLDLLEAPSRYPAGFRYQNEVISAEEERRALAEIQGLPFREFEFHGYVGKRRTVSFGASYDFATERLGPADEMPGFLQSLRERVAAFAEVAPERLAQVLVTEYAPGAGIGWHRDKAVFGEVVGLSLSSSCRFRLRRQRGQRWERCVIETTPGSAYLLSGPARTEWEHSIPPVDTLRYSVTYRTLLDS